jgi:hypothetical protein
MMRMKIMIDIIAGNTHPSKYWGILRPRLGTKIISREIDRKISPAW